MQIPTAANPDHTMQRSCLHQSLRAILHWQLQQPFGSFRKGETCSPLCIWLFRLYGRFPCSSLIPALSWRQGGGTHPQDNPLDISNMNLTYDYYQENENTSTDEEKTQKRERRKTHGIHSAIGNHRVHVTLRNLVQASSTCPRGGERHQHGAGTFVYEIVGLYVSVWLSIDKPL